MNREMKDLLQMLRDLIAAMVFLVINLTFSKWFMVTIDFLAINPLMAPVTMIGLLVSIGGPIFFLLFFIWAVIRFSILCSSKPWETRKRKEK